MAVEWYRRAADQGNRNAQVRLGSMYAKGVGVPKDPTQAIRWYNRAAQGADAQTLNSVAWGLATSNESELRDSTNAVFFAEGAVSRTNRKDPMILDTLAAAYAEAGMFAKAVATQKEAIALLKSEMEKEDYTARLQLYESGKPFRETVPPDQ